MPSGICSSSAEAEAGATLQPLASWSSADLLRLRCTGDGAAVALVSDHDV